MTQTTTAPASQLSGAVYYTEHVFVQSLAPLLAEHAGVHLKDPNALWGDADVEGMHVELHTLVEPGDAEWIEQDARLNAAWDELVEPVIAAQQSHVIVQVEQITDARAAQDLFSRIIMVLARVGGANAVHLPDQQLATTGVLYLNDWQQSGDGPKVLTWFNTAAMWEDEQHTTSMAITRGLGLMGYPEVQFFGVPWEPSETRDAVRSIVGSMLAQQVPFMAGIEFQLGDAPFVLVEVPDPFNGQPTLAMLPSAVAAEHTTSWAPDPSR